MNEFEKSIAHLPWELYYRTSEGSAGRQYFDTQKEAEAVALILKGEAEVLDFDFPIVSYARPGGGSRVVFTEVRHRGFEHRVE